MLNPIRIGLFFGIFIALWHVGWSVLVATNLAQKLIDFVFWLHFITPPFQIEPFDPARAGMLIVIVFGVGYVIGAIGAVIWNMLQRQAAPGASR